MARPKLLQAPRLRGRPPSTPGAPVHRKRHERIEITDAVEFSEALNFARHLGREPNLFVTIQWKHAECDRDTAHRTRRLINLCGTWTQRKAGLTPVWAYVREAGLRKGEHLHLVIHTPPALHTKFRKALWGWIETEATGEAKRTAVRIMPIREGDLHGKLKSYLLKDGTDEVRRNFWIPKHHHRTVGALMGKRIKVSHSIGPSARKASQSPVDGHDGV